MYIFILGKTPRLAKAEITSFLKRKKINHQLGEQGDNFLIIEINKGPNCQNILKQLGGTVKIGQLIISRKQPNFFKKEIFIKNLPPTSDKALFGFSCYGLSQKRNKQLKKLAMDIKKEMKNFGRNCRLVTAKTDALSSVVVTKNKLVERGADFLIVQGKQKIYLGKTLAVQNFADYSHRDYGRPARDIRSGTMPPKLAQMMINLAEAPEEEIILDPFCGSGTILGESLLMGYQNIIGADLSKKAIKGSEKNLRWLAKNYQLIMDNLQLRLLDARRLSSVIKPRSIGAIITEPYLGPPLKGNESEQKLKKIIKELSPLYLKVFQEFKKVLKPRSRVVIVFPVLKYKNQFLKLSLGKKIKALGFKLQSSYIYSRPGQKVLREIFVFTKT